MNKEQSILVVGSFQPQFKTSLMADMDVNGNGNGIYTYSLDETSGELTKGTPLYGVINPAAFCFDAEHKRIYSASDTNDFINWQAGSGGGVYTFGLTNNKQLTPLDSRSSCGVRAVDLCCDYNGKYLTVLNQGSPFCSTHFIKTKNGNFAADIHFDEKCVVLFKVNKNGIERVCDRYVFPDSEQTVPNAIKMDHDGYLYIISGGSDSVDILKLDDSSASLKPVTHTKTSKFCGLSDIVLHPSLPVFYCACKESGDILVYSFDKDSKQINLLHRAWEEEPSHPEVIALNDDGSCLYAFDGKEGEIKIYAVSPEGKLVLFQRKTLVKDKVHQFHDLAISKSGKWIICSDILNNELYVCGIQQDGRIDKILPPTPAETPTGLILI